MTSTPAKGWKVEVDGRKVEDEASLFDWIRSSSAGKVLYQKVLFSPQKGVHPSRKKNFTDGYWMYTFWFPKKADAALFRIWWCL